jgi:hypothetical protein
MRSAAAVAIEGVADRDPVDSLGAAVAADGLVSMGASLGR